MQVVLGGLHPGGGVGGRVGADTGGGVSGAVGSTGTLGSVGRFGCVGSPGSETTWPSRVDDTDSSPAAMRLKSTR